jgi:hypothetical protein
LFEGRPEEGEELVVQRRQVQDERGLAIRPMADMKQPDVLEALEHPPHGWSVCGLLELIGDRLPGRGQLLTQPVFG